MGEIVGGKGYHDFPSKVLCLSVSKLFNGIIYSESKILRSKILCIRRGHHSFLSKIRCLTVPKNFVGQPFVFHEASGIEKHHGLDGGMERLSRFSDMIFLSQCFEKFHWGTL